MHHRAWPIGWLIGAMLLLAAPAPAQQPAPTERVALVIGNGAYRSAVPLANPANDARAMAGLLQRLGFRVDTGIDLERLAMEELVATFEEEARAADVAFVFYAGHGIQVAGRNYLVPIDASLQRESDVRRLIEADWVLESAGRARRLAVVFLDACRDNPLAATYAAASRSAAVGRGLASIGRAPPNMLVAYATAADATAADGQGVHSPFTTALLEHLPTPGVELRLALGRVRDAVAQHTGQQQIPYTYGSLGGDEFYLVAPSPPEGPTPPSVQLLARPEGGAGPAFRDCPTCPELVPLAAGRFNLGSPGGEAGHEADEAPQRPIALAKPFAIGRFEITFTEWDACVAASACPWRPDDRGLGRVKSMRIVTLPRRLAATVRSLAPVPPRRATPACLPCPPAATTSRMATPSARRPRPLEHHRSALLPDLDQVAVQHPVALGHRRRRDRHLGGRGTRPRGLQVPPGGQRRQDVPVWFQSDVTTAKDCIAFA